jgi:hypothetical protein
MKPLPWSYTALEDFVNCPRAYHQKRVLKKFKEEKTEAIIWGEYVHKAFELRQAENKELPIELMQHEDLMKKLEDKPGLFYTEQKIALDKKAKPCNFFYADVWYRGVIDYVKVHESNAVLIDYKTGKPHEKFKQLMLFALHTFELYPEVTLVNAQFYWTKTQTTTRKIWDRKEIPDLWRHLIPDLKQYAQAFKDDTWQPRQSGLCNGWCPVTDCEFWKPRRQR